MKTKRELLIEETRALIAQLDDQDDLRLRIERMIAEKFPVKAKPVFTPFATMAFHQFLDVFRQHYAKGVEPEFCQWPVMVEDGEDGEIRLHFLNTARAQESDVELLNR